MKNIFKKLIFSFKEALNCYPELYPLGNVKRDVDELDIYKDYKNNIDEANKILKSKKIKFYNFLQPYCESGIKKRSPFESMSNAHLRRVKDRDGKNFYEIIRNFYRFIDKNKIMNTDNLQNIFDKTDSELYLDNVHISNKGNIIIAKKIVKKIIEDE